MAYLVTYILVPQLTANRNTPAVRRMLFEPGVSCELLLSKVSTIYSYYMHCILIYIICCAGQLCNVYVVLYTDREREDDLLCTCIQIGVGDV